MKAGPDYLERDEVLRGLAEIGERLAREGAREDRRGLMRAFNRILRMRAANAVPTPPEMEWTGTNRATRCSRCGKWGLREWVCCPRCGAVRTDEERKETDADER